MYRLAPGLATVRTSLPAACSRVAFSLTELLVVVAIITLLAAILFPALRGARAAAWGAACSSNLRQTATACAAYAAERRVLPNHPTISIYDLMELPTDLSKCPANRESNAGHEAGGGADPAAGLFDSYWYPATAFDFRDRLRRPRWDLITRAYEQNPRTPLIQDFLRFHGFRNVAGFDGGVTQDHEPGMEIVLINPGGGN